MTLLDALKAMQQFLKENVAEKILLQKEPEQGAVSDPSQSNSYVHPSVTIIRMPHENFDPTGYRVPFLAVCMDTDVDDDDGHTADFRIVAGVYGGGNYDGDTDPEGIPDNKGYIDLINLLEKVKISIASASILGGMCVVRKPFSIKFYDDDTWPYWYGYLSFTAEMPAVPVGIE